jgi:hypothetical protein
LSLSAPKVLEPIRRQLGVANRARVSWPRLARAKPQAWRCEGHGLKSFTRIDSPRRFAAPGRDLKRPQPLAAQRRCFGAAFIRNSFCEFGYSLMAVREPLELRAALRGLAERGFSAPKWLSAGASAASVARQQPVQAERPKVRNRRPDRRTHNCRAAQGAPVLPARIPAWRTPPTRSRLRRIT